MSEQNRSEPAAPAVGSPLQHAVGRLDPERAAFDAWFSDGGKWPAAVRRSGDGYMLAAAQSAWTAWQACLDHCLSQLDQTARHMRENAAALRQWPHLAQEARARELAACSVESMVNTWRLHRQLSAALERHKATPLGGAMSDDSDPVVGHKTFHDGPMQTRHEPLRASEATALMAALDEAKRRRAESMPTEQDAVRAMSEAYHRLEELGWRNATYCPRDGRTLLFVEAGSAGIHEGHCDDQDTAHCRPTVWLHDAGDLWPSQPVLYREPPNAVAHRTP